MSSILIRKHCQPILDELGYPMFHATTTDNRYEPKLQIFTSCGKPFVEVHGVKFSGYKLSAAECEYTSVLLQDWLNRHQKDFEDFVDSYVEYHSTKSPNNTLVEDELKIEIQSSNTCKIYREFPFIDDEGEEKTFWMTHIIRFDTGKITNIGWPGNPLTLDELHTCITIPQDILDKAVAFRNTHQSYWELKEHFQEVRDRINTCSI